MNEVVLDGSMFRVPDCFCKPEITLKTHNDLGDNDGKCLDTNEPSVI